ncbi:MAG: hypothetical protein U5L96_20705 [Owenweeksia sp.]|nr:hypothetical protein [Owenweeksia sp.]
MSAIKEWSHDEDIILRKLCNMLLNRKLPGVKIGKSPFGKDEVAQLRKQAAKSMQISLHEASYFVFEEFMSNSAYTTVRDQINLPYKDGSLMDVSKAADQMNISALAEPVVRHFLFYPKSLR